MKLYYLLFSCCVLAAFSCRKASNVPNSTSAPLNDSAVADGYMDKLSYGNGDQLTYYVNAPQSVNNVSLGIYDVNGHLVDHTAATNLSPQTIIQSEPYANGYGYQKSGTYTISNNLPGGMYFLANKLPFIVKNSTNSKNPILVIYPSNTDFAYNALGGKSFYFPDFTQRSRVVSFLRPWQIRSSTMGFMQWATQLGGEGLKFDYMTDMDLDAAPDISNYQLVVMIGHCEYWTRGARLKISQFVDAGKNLLILAANTFWWQARYDTTRTQLICYKFTTGGEDHQSNPLLRTYNGDNPILQFPIMNETGASYRLGGFYDANFSFSQGYKVLADLSPLLAGTGLKKGDFIPLQKTHEFDGTFVNYVQISPTDSVPTPDRSKINFYRYELIGYTPTHIDGDATRKGIATFVVGQRTPSTGIVVNAACETWCGSCMQDPNGGINKAITLNALKLLLNGGDVFSPGQ